MTMICRELNCQKIYKSVEELQDLVHKIGSARSLIKENNIKIQNGFLFQKHFHDNPK